MDLGKAESMARMLMKRYGLYSWEFHFDRAVHSFGQCHFDDKKITLSRQLVRLNVQKEVRDTILHEIAHALTGKRAQPHGPKWRAIAKSIGCRGERCFDSDKVKMPAYLYQHKCSGCDHVFGRYRKPKHRVVAWQCECGQVNLGRLVRNKIA